MSRIFISYRRDDSPGYAGRIHERLSSVFGGESVFMDMDDITPGTNFARAIEDSVDASEAAVVLIGKQWLTMKDASGRRRIDNPEDFVHIEVARALERNIRVIPILLNNASMPTENDLPPKLRLLARFQAIELSDERWDYDIGQLVKVLGGKAENGAKRDRFVKTAIIGVAVVVAVLLYVFQPWKERVPDVTGQWIATVEYDFGGTHAEPFVFRVDEGILSGTASFLGVDRGILEGKVEGNQITFVTRTEEIAGDDSREAIHMYRGIIDNDGIQFTLQTQGGFSDHPPIRFVAKRSQEQVRAYGEEYLNPGTVSNF